MTEQKTVLEMVNESILVSQFYDKQIEMTLKYFENTNPVERVMKSTAGIDNKEIITNVNGKVQVMMNSWLDSYAAALSQSQFLPVDLLGNAADLARKIRSQNGSPTEVRAIVGKQP